MAQPTAYKTAKGGTEQEHSRSSPETAETKGNHEPAEHEKWLYENPEALADVKRGLADSAAGRGVKMSFLEFADDDVDE